MLNDRFEGHAIGFAHEHQRPDAGNWIEFRCQYLKGYDQAKEAISKAPIGSDPAKGQIPPDWKDLDVEERMKRM